MTSAEHGAADISNRGAQQRVLQSFDGGRRGLAQNSKDMGAAGQPCEAAPR